MAEFITAMPHHVALIMDGNGRWAKERGYERSKGHEQGAKRLKELISQAASLGIKEFSVFAFSTENWSRPADEVGRIFELLSQNLSYLQDEFVQAGISLKVFGDVSSLSCKSALKAAELATSKGSLMRFNLGLNYGSIDEVARAANNLAKRKIPITATSLMQALDINTQVDLLIRTGARARLSNFLLLQCAYAHIAFSDTYFPDFTKEEFVRLINEYRCTPRTFGGVH